MATNPVFGAVNHDQWGSITKAIFQKIVSDVFVVEEYLVLQFTDGNEAVIEWRSGEPVVYDVRRHKDYGRRKTHLAELYQLLVGKVLFAAGKDPGSLGLYTTDGHAIFIDWTLGYPTLLRSDVTVLLPVPKFIAAAAGQM